MGSNKDFSLLFHKGSLHGYLVLHAMVKTDNHSECGGREASKTVEAAAAGTLKGECCVVLGEPVAVLELASKDREGSPEAGIHEPK